MGAIAIIALIWIVYKLIKEAAEPTIPSEYWENVSKTNDIYDLDAKTFQRNLRNGKYKSKDE